MISPCLTLSNIRYVSRVNWSNQGKGVAPSPTPRCSSYWKGSLLVANFTSFFFYLHKAWFRCPDVWWQKFQFQLVCVYSGWGQLIDIWCTFWSPSKFLPFLQEDQLCILNIKFNPLPCGASRTAHLILQSLDSILSPLTLS